jgi:hypothetical protein
MDGGSPHRSAVGVISIFRLTACCDLLFDRFQQRQVGRSVTHTSRPEARSRRQRLHLRDRPFSSVLRHHQHLQIDGREAGMNRVPLLHSLYNHETCPCWHGGGHVTKNADTRVVVPVVQDPLQRVKVSDGVKVAKQVACSELDALPDPERVSAGARMGCVPPRSVAAPPRRTSGQEVRRAGRRRRP